MRKCFCRIFSTKLLIILILALGSFFLPGTVAGKNKDTLILALPLKLCWSYQIKTIGNVIASDNDEYIVTSTLKGKIFALELNSGEKLWETELGGRVVSDLIINEDKKNIFVVTKFFSDKEQSDQIQVRSIAKNSGITNWQTSLSVTTLHYGQKTNEQNISIFLYDHKIIVSDQNSFIAALSENNGQILWEKPLKTQLSSIYFDLPSKNLAIISEDKIALANIDTGEHIFQKQLNLFPITAYFFDGTILILGNKKGDAFAVDLKTNKIIWKFRAGAEISNISLTSEGILITSFDNFIYLIASKNGKGIWRKRLENRVIISPFVFDKYVVVTTSGSVTTNIIDLKEGRLVNQIYLDADNYFINRPVLSRHLIAFPTANGIFAFTNSDNRCADGKNAD